MSDDSRNRQDEFNMDDLISFMLNNVFNDPEDLQNINRLLSTPSPAPSPSPVSIFSVNHAALINQAFRPENNLIRDGGNVLNPRRFPLELQVKPMSTMPLVSNVQSCHGHDDEKNIEGGNVNKLDGVNEESVQGGNGQSVEKREDKQHERDKRGRKRKGAPSVDDDERKETTNSQITLSATRSHQRKQEEGKEVATGAKKDAEKLKKLRKTLSAPW